MLLNTACGQQVGFAAFLGFFLNLGKYPFPSLSLPSRALQEQNTSRWALNTLLVVKKAFMRPQNS